MRFAYRPYNALPSPADRSDEVFRPALKVRVRGMNSPLEIPLWGILDTGAVECVLPFEVADLVKAVPVAGGWFLTDYTGRPHDVEYGAVSLQIRLKARIVRWTAVVAFDRRRAGEALWGVAHFLEHFRVTFDGPGKHFTIRLLHPLPPTFSTSPVPGRTRRGPGAPIAPDDQEP